MSPIVTDANRSEPKPKSIWLSFCIIKNANGQNILLVDVLYDSPEQEAIMTPSTIASRSMGDYLFDRVELSDSYYFDDVWAPQLFCRIVFEDDDLAWICRWLRGQHFDLKGYLENVGTARHGNSRASFFALES